MLADHAIAWMLTYLLHSTLLLGLAWLVSKPLSRWSVAAEETVWKLALVGAVLTASLQLAMVWEPAAGRWGLEELSRGAAEAVAAEPAEAPAPRLPVASAPVSRPVEIPVPAPAFRLSLPPMTSLALGAWGLGAAFLLTGYGVAWLRLRRRLKVRPRVVGGTMFSQLRSLAMEAGILEDVHLSCSSRVPVPLALGLRRREICVPPRALAGLTREQQEGMLAHELAHLVRRDPFWLVLSHTLASIFFFQPLNWVARRRLREISEMLSDEWAVTRTGRPLSLAGCLAEVAGWSSVRRALPVPGMADRPSNLAQRIRRLLDDNRSPERPLRRVLLGAAMAVLVIAVAAAAPAISASRPQMPEPPAAPEAPMLMAAADSAEAPEPPQAREREAKPIFDEEKFERDFEAKFEEDFTAEFMEEFEKEFAFAEEFEFEFEFPHEFEHEFEYEFDTDEVVAHAMAAVDGALAGSADWGKSGHRELTPEEEEKLERDMERMSEEIERSLKPHQEKMERLSREISEKVSRMNTGEMERLASEMAKIAERMHPNEEEMERFQAQMRKYGDERRLTDEEREQVRREAREMARKMRPSDEDMKRMRELREEMRKHQAEMRRQVTDEDRAEMRKAQEEMRRAIELHSQSVRDQVRRSMDEQRLQLREEDRERREERKQRRQEDRERRHNGDEHNDPSGPSH